MRTTLSIDDDVLIAARHLADHQRKSLGEVVSTLARQALQGGAATAKSSSVRNGVPLLPKREGASLVTLELVNQLRDDQP